MAEPDSAGVVVVELAETDSVYPEPASSPSASSPPAVSDYVS